MFWKCKMKHCFDLFLLCFYDVYCSGFLEDTNLTEICKYCCFFDDVSLLSFSMHTSYYYTFLIQLVRVGAARVSFFSQKITKWFMIHWFDWFLWLCMFRLSVLSIRINSAVKSSFYFMYHAYNMCSVCIIVKDQSGKQLD